MTTTELPDDPWLDQLWRDPEDGTLKRRYHLGHTYNGKLYLKRARDGGSHLYWTGEDIESALSSGLFVTMQAARALVAIRADRPVAQVYHPLPQETNWRHENVNFLCSLVPGRYLVENRKGGGHTLWQVAEPEPGQPHKMERRGSSKPRAKLLPRAQRGSK